MNNEDIKRARQKYNNYKFEKEKLILLQKEFDEIRNNPFVQRYFELEKMIKKPLSDDAIIRYSFSNVELTKIPNEEKIYIYMGAYKCDTAYDSRSDILVDNIEYADYLLYMNLDNSFDSVTIPIKLKDKFEQKFTVLKFKNTFNIEKKYYELQQYYFRLLLDLDLRKKSKVLSLLKERIN